VEAGQAIERALVPQSPVEKPSELVRSEEPPPAPAERIKPASRIEESMAEKMSKLKKAADATKNNVRVTEQVFSCVTDYAIIRGVDKVNVVTYLLYEKGSIAQDDTRISDQGTTGWATQPRPNVL
jgi:hypothetical protein